MTHSAQSKRPKVFVTRKTQDLEKLCEEFSDLDIQFNETNQNLSREELMKHAKDHDALITMLCDQIDQRFIHENNHLKVISNYAVGLNNIDLNAAQELGIKVGHTPGVLTHTTAETAILLLLNITRSYVNALQSVKTGQWKTWEPTLFNGIDLRNKTLGIIGFGRIGQDFAKKAYALWGLKIVVLKRPSNENLKLSFPFTPVSQEEFFAETDVISLHCPLNNQTENLIDKEFIKKMRKNFFLINTSRGQVHVENDLVEGLQSGKILGVGLDVTNPEPMMSNHNLLNFPNVEVIPHIGSATDLTRSEMTKMCLRNISAGLKGDQLPYAAF